ncbi:tyrosine-type recombinase/integrase [Streptomyces abikoensis]
MHKINSYRRCACKEPKLDSNGAPIVNVDGSIQTRQLGARCPDLNKKKNHGAWYFTIELEADASGRRKRVRRGGFTTKTEAEQEAKKVSDQADKGINVDSNETVEQFLTTWLKSKRGVARHTIRNYRDNTTRFLIPHLGMYKMRDLRLHHLDAMYNAMQEESDQIRRAQEHAEQADRDCAAKKKAWQNAPAKSAERRALRLAWITARRAAQEARRGLRRPAGPATLRLVNNTLSSALRSAVARQLITHNWATLVELPTVKKTKALVWTDERVELWQTTGKRPSPVMVWTPEQTGRFLDLATSHRLYPLWHTLTFLGLRRGEICALRWSEVNLKAGWLRISAQIVKVDGRLHTEQPKADSLRTIPINDVTASLLQAWREKQRLETAAIEDVGGHVNSDLVFTKENGEGYQPDDLTHMFRRLISSFELPPIRLHDLRHGSATLSLLAGNDIKVVQERLGHSHRWITSDTYTSVLPQLIRAEAESTMAVVPRVAHDAWPG